MVPDSLLVAAARRFALLSDPTRLRLLRTLHEEGAMRVGELAARSGPGTATGSPSQSTVPDSSTMCLAERSVPGASLEFGAGDTSLRTARTSLAL